MDQVISSKQLHKILANLSQSSQALIDILSNISENDSTLELSDALFGMAYKAHRSFDAKLEKFLYQIILHVQTCEVDWYELKDRLIVEQHDIKAACSMSLFSIIQYYQPMFFRILDKFIDQKIEKECTVLDQYKYLRLHPYLSMEYIIELMLYYEYLQDSRYTIRKIYNFFKRVQQYHNPFVRMFPDDYIDNDTTAVLKRNIVYSIGQLGQLLEHCDETKKHRYNVELFALHSRLSTLI